MPKYKTRGDNIWAVFVTSRETYTKILSDLRTNECLSNGKYTPAPEELCNISQPRWNIFPIYPCHANYNTIVLSEKYICIKF